MLTISLDGDHFGIHTVGEVTMFIIKTIFIAAPAEPVIDDLYLDFLILQTNNAIRANFGE